MTKTVNKITRNGHSYYTVIDQKWVNGKLVRKYIGYLGKTPNSKQEIKSDQILIYIERLLDNEISDTEISKILKKIGIEVDVWPITKVILENDRNLKKLFLRFK